MPLPSRVSPWPWIADNLWSSWQGRATRDDDATPVVREALVVEVCEDDLRRAPVMAVSGLAAPLGALAEHADLLRRTVGAGRVVGAHWPVCCGALATLLVHHGGGADLTALLALPGVDRCLLRSLADEQADDPAVALGEFASLIARVRARKHSGEGVDLFQCRRCGRVYGGYSEP